MINRIFIAIALVALSSAVFAQAADRDVYLTSEGTLYTIESVYAQDLTDVESQSSQVLRLTITQGDKPVVRYVPDSLLGGSHTSPALAYDPDSKALFVFWERGVNNHLSSDLVFCSFQNGRWSETSSIDSADYHRSHNLRIGVTRKTESYDRDNKMTVVPELNVHAIWWEESGQGEKARYTMLTIEKGIVTAPIVVRDLTEFSDTSTMMNRTADREANPDVLRYPALFESAGHDSIGVVYGDLTTNTLHRVDIRPTLRPGVDIRAHIPIGRRDHDFGAPHIKGGDTAGARVSAIGTDDDRVLFYFTAKNAVNYVMYRDGQWSPLRSIATGEKLSTEGAVDVLRKMVNAE